MDHVFAWLMGLLSFIPGLGPAAPPSWNGYVEVDYAYAAAPSAGTIEAIDVNEGESVRKGDVLFTLEASQQQAAHDAAAARAEAAEAQVVSARATLANLKTGARPAELQVTEAALLQAQANAALAQQNFDRAKDLYAKGTTPKSQLDQAQASLDAANAAVRQLEAQLAVAKLPARDDQIAAAEASVAAAQSAAVAAKADAANAKAMLDNRMVAAPEDGRIERLFFKAGEVAGAGVPVLSMRGGDALKVKFYLSQADRTQFALGEEVSVSCDGCPAGLTGTLSYFSSDPEFTPPIIYSRDERHRLVFLTEATMAADSAILPGQPVSVGLLE